MIEEDRYFPLYCLMSLFPSADRALIARDHVWISTLDITTHDRKMEYHAMSMDSKGWSFVKCHVYMD